MKKYFWWGLEHFICRCLMFLLQLLWCDIFRLTRQFPSWPSSFNYLEGLSGAVVARWSVPRSCNSEAAGASLLTGMTPAEGSNQKKNNLEGLSTLTSNIWPWLHTTTLLLTSATTTCSLVLDLSHEVSALLKHSSHQFLHDVACFHPGSAHPAVFSALPNHHCTVACTDGPTYTQTHSP